MRDQNVLVFTLLFSSLAFGRTLPNPAGLKVNYENPDPKVWKMNEEMGPTVDKDGKNKTRGYIMFKHTPIMDSNRRPIEPVFGIFYENNVKGPKDVTEYSVNFIGDKPYKPKTNLLGGYPNYSSDKNSVVFDGEYTREEVKHRIYLGYVFRGGTGVEVVADSTDGVFPQVQKEMLKFLKSVTLVSE